MKEKSSAVITFGELLLRLDTPGHERFVQAESFAASYTGGEANVAVALAQWGLQTFAVSKVPEHEIGQACVNMLRRYGVNTDHVLRGGDRLGILYVETGASQTTGRLGVTSDDVFDHGARQRPWHDVMPFFRERGRGPRDRGDTVGLAAGFATGME